MPIFRIVNVFRPVVLHTALLYLAAIALELARLSVWTTMPMLKCSPHIEFVWTGVGLLLHSITLII